MKPLTDALRPFALPDTGSNEFVLKPNDITFISQMIRRASRAYLFFGFFLLAFDALLIGAIASRGAQAEPADPVLARVFVTATLLVIVGVAIACFRIVFSPKPTFGDRLYKVLVETPQAVTSLAIHFIQNKRASDKLSRSIVAELRTQDEQFRIPVSAEHHSLLRQYLRLNSPRAEYREELHFI